jgi:hypothetical protein
MLRRSDAVCFLSYVEYRSNINISNITYTYKYIQNLYPKVEVELVEETKERGEKERKIINNNEICHNNNMIIKKNW